MKYFLVTETTEKPIESQAEMKILKTVVSVLLRAVSCSASASILGTALILQLQTLAAWLFSWMGPYPISHSYYGGKQTEICTPVGLIRGRLFVKVGKTIFGAIHSHIGSVCRPITSRNQNGTQTLQSTLDLFLGNIKL